MQVDEGTRVFDRGISVSGLTEIGQDLSVSYSQFRGNRQDGEGIRSGARFFRRACLPGRYPLDVKIGLGPG
jgi:hypothetical protein